MPFELIVARSSQPKTRLGRTTHTERSRRELQHSVVIGRILCGCEIDVVDQTFVRHRVDFTAPGQSEGCNRIRSGGNLDDTLDFFILLKPPYSSRAIVAENVDAAT